MSHHAALALEEGVLNGPALVVDAGRLPLCALVAALAQLWVW